MKAIDHAAWKTEVVLRDDMRIYNFPEELVSHRLRVRVPFGRRFYEGKPLPPDWSDVAAPILAIARGETPEDWCGRGVFRGKDHLKVMAIDAEPIEEGPLLAKYRVAYRLAGGRRYTVLLPWFTVISTCAASTIRSSIHKRACIFRAPWPMLGPGALPCSKGRD